MTTIEEATTDAGQLPLSGFSRILNFALKKRCGVRHEHIYSAPGGIGSIIYKLLCFSHHSLLGLVINLGSRCSPPALLAYTLLAHFGGCVIFWYA
jgi:hypothetical protein